MVRKSCLLTDLMLRNAKPSTKEVTLKDGNGLFALLHPNGTIYFHARYTLDGKERKVSLGPYPKTSLSEARTKLTNLKEGLKQNIDPVIEKRKRKADSQLDAQATFQAVAEEWLVLKAKKVKPTYHKKISSTLKTNTFKRLGSIPINDITSNMLLETLKVMEARGAIDLMHSLRALLAELFNYAKAINRYKGENPANCLKGSVALQKHVSKPYQKLRSEQDVGLFLRRLSEYPGTIPTKLLVKLQMLVATRPTEMRTATWDEIDFEKAIWTIKKERMKMGVEHVIPLPKQALEDLATLKQLTGHTQYLFPSHTKSGTLSEGTANKALKTIWPEYLIHPHGFRHLFSTLANEHDHTKADIIEAALAHKDTNQIRGTYNKATYMKERRDLAQWYADYLDGLMMNSTVILKD